MNLLKKAGCIIGLLFTGVIALEGVIDLIIYPDMFSVLMTGIFAAAAYGFYRLLQGNNTKVKQPRGTTINSKEQHKFEQMEKEENQYSELIQLGRNQMKQLRLLNIRIEDEETKSKITQIMQITRNVMEFIERHSNKEGEANRYFRYYIDNIIKLLEQYDEIESSDLQTENMQKSKEKISNVLDTSIKAFHKFYDDLYDDTVLDVQVDSKVLEDVFKQEGLL